MVSILNKQLLNTSKVVDTIMTVLVIIGAFFVPTFLAKIVPLGAYQQVIVGSIVNMSLILTALYTKGIIKTLAIVTLPSVSTILGGVLFEDITLYAKVMIPAIWLGNFILVYLYKCLFLKYKYNYIISAIFSTFLKVMVIYLGFTMMIKVMSVPENVIQTLSVSMGVMQAITATNGSIIAFSVMKVFNKNKV